MNTNNAAITEKIFIENIIEWRCVRTCRTLSSIATKERGRDGEAGGRCRSAAEEIAVLDDERYHAKFFRNAVDL